MRQETPKISTMARAKPTRGKPNNPFLRVISKWEISKSRTNTKFLPRNKVKPSSKSPPKSKSTLIKLVLNIVKSQKFVSATSVKFPPATTSKNSILFHKKHTCTNASCSSQIFRRWVEYSYFYIIFSLLWLDIFLFLSVWNILLVMLNEWALSRSNMSLIYGCSWGLNRYHLVG